MKLYQLVLVGVLELIGGHNCSPPCTHYGCPVKPLFLPALPGQTPSCAKHGQTYCEEIEHYPTHTIQYLVERWQYDYGSLFSSERRELKPRPIYGPPSYTMRNRPHRPPAQQYNTISNQTDVVYPNRKHPLGDPALHVLSDDPGFIYSAIIHPELAAQVTQYDRNSWWKRYNRSSRKKRANDALKRNKRQSGSISLCPTSPQFIMPRAALNNKGNWMYVVNLDQDQRFTQLVRSETCISSECDGICSLPNGYTSKCEQQFVQKRLVALDGGGMNLYTDLFWLPHCCICQISANNA